MRVNSRSTNLLSAALPAKQAASSTLSFLDALADSSGQSADGVLRVAGIRSGVGSAMGRGLGVGKQAKGQPSVAPDVDPFTAAPSSAAAEVQPVPISAVSVSQAELSLPVAASPAGPLGAPASQDSPNSDSNSSSASEPAQQVSWTPQTSSPLADSAAAAAASAVSRSAPAISAAANAASALQPQAAAASAATSFLDQLSADLVPQATAESFAAPVAPAAPQPGSGTASSNPSLGRVAQKDAVQTDGRTASGGASIPAAARGQVSQFTVAAADASSHGARDNSHPSQHTPSDSTSRPAAMQTAAFGVASQSPTAASQAAAMPTQSVAAQTQPVIMAGGMQATSPAPLASASLSDLPRHVDPSAAAVSSDGEVPMARSSINTAGLIQTMGTSEMRVGMHSAEFGNISIRTTVSPQQMLTQISLDHSGLSQAISAHVPAAQARLGNDLGLRALIEVNHQSGSSSSGDSSGSSSGSGPRGQAHTPQPLPAGALAAEQDSDQATADQLEPGLGLAFLTTTGTATGNGYRLDIRA